jgi:hypothetical protein
MSQIVCSTSVLSVGCKFVDWSINYLAGKTEFLSKTQGKIKLVDNPLTEKNAHLHKANHPKGYQEVKEYVEFLETQNSDFSLYPHTIQDIEAASNLNIDVDNMTSVDLEAIVEYKKNDYQLILDYLDQKRAKIVLVSMSDPVPLYFINPRSNVIPYKSDQRSGSPDQIRQQIDDLFFKQSQKEWKEIDLTNIWDQRERQALNLRPFETQYFDVVQPATTLEIDALDLWQHGDKKIINIMDYCQLPMDQTRFYQWHKIYIEWQKIQLKALEFQYEYRTILESIVNGKSMKIDLTFNQEIVIQHCLIYQYNLNLKTWKLEKFPSDTIELHHLLEPNIHPVVNIY